MATLSQPEIDKRLEARPGWGFDGTDIRRVFDRGDFVGALSFVVSVGLLAQTLDHHPDIDIRWNEVTIAVSTHSEDGITELDFTLAEAVDGIA